MSMQIKVEPTKFCVDPNEIDDERKDAVLVSEFFINSSVAVKLEDTDSNELSWLPVEHNLITNQPNITIKEEIILTEEMDIKDLDLSRVDPTNDTDLMRKQNDKTQANDKSFKCKICDFSVKRKRQLNYHMTSHSGDKPFICTVCEYRTSRKANLQQHLICHATVKPFKCSSCEFSTKRTDQLKRHVLRHTGEKPFKCNICEYRTAQQINLKLHVLSHAENKYDNSYLG